MSEILAAVEALEVPHLIDLCQDAELTAAENNQKHPHPTIHLLAVLLQEDLNEAKFLWKRLPLSLQQNAETKAAWSLARALWKRDYSAFFEAAKQEWDKEAGHLVRELVRRRRETGIELMELSYSCIGLQRAGILLGLDQSGLEQLCQREGWRIHGEFIEIETIKRNRRRSVNDAVKRGELQLLTEQLMKLQTTR